MLIAVVAKYSIIVNYYFISSITKQEYTFTKQNIEVVIQSPRRYMYNVLKLVKNVIV